MERIPMTVGQAFEFCRAAGAMTAFSALEDCRKANVGLKLSTGLWDMQGQVLHEYLAKLTSPTRGHESLLHFIGEWKKELEAARRTVVEAGPLSVSGLLRELQTLNQEGEDLLRKHLIACTVHGLHPLDHSEVTGALEMFLTIEAHRTDANACLVWDLATTACENYARKT